MGNLNVNINIAEAKDLIEGRIGDKYLGSLDYSLLTDYIEGEEDLKDIIKEVDGARYSDDIISVNFNYGWEDSRLIDCLFAKSLGVDRFNALNIALKSCSSNKDKESVRKHIKYLKDNEYIKKDIKKKLNEFVEEELENLKLKDKLIATIKLKNEEKEVIKNNKKVRRKEVREDFNESNKELYEKYKNLKSKKSKATKNKEAFKEEKEYNAVKKEYGNKLKKEMDSDFELNENILKEVEFNNDISKIKKIAKKERQEISMAIKNNYIKSTADLRKQLYEKGFVIGNKHYVRFLRSSGAARTGKCLFINKEYYDRIMKWIYAGIDVEGQSIDLAGFESYISLIASGSIGRFNLESKNILLINDYYSKFLNDEDTMVTRLINKIYNDKNDVISGDLETTRERLKINNNIFDGECVIDSSIFKETEMLREKVSLEDKATLQIRNKFYKGQGIKADLQKFYKDYCEEKGLDFEKFEVEDMFGNKMLVKDVLMITTPSSLKYLKYFKDKKVGYNKWKEVVGDTWAICKYDKPTHHFD